MYCVIQDISEIQHKEYRNKLGLKHVKVHC